MHPESNGDSIKDRIPEIDDCETEFACIVRLLLDDGECGKVIGKGGSRIKEIRAQSTAGVQLTKSTSLYPGTKCKYDGFSQSENMSLQM